MLIAAADAPKHVGETVTVEGTVSAVHTDSRSGVTFIDMGGRYPDQAFTGVIFKEDASKFPNVESLTGKVVDMTGPVHAFKGKARDHPERSGTDKNQIKQMAGEKARLAALIGAPVGGLVSGFGRRNAALWQLSARRQKFNQIPPVTVTVY